MKISAQLLSLFFASINFPVLIANLTIEFIYFQNIGRNFNGLRLYPVSEGRRHPQRVPRWHDDSGNVGADDGADDGWDDGRVGVGTKERRVGRKRQGKLPMQQQRPLSAGVFSFRQGNLYSRIDF